MMLYHEFPLAEIVFQMTTTTTTIVTMTEMTMMTMMMMMMKSKNQRFCYEMAAVVIQYPSHHFDIDISSMIVLMNVSWYCHYNLWLWVKWEMRKRRWM